MPGLLKLMLEWTWEYRCLFRIMISSRYVLRSGIDIVAVWFLCLGIRDQIANIPWIIEKVREFQKNIYFCFIDYAKVFDFVEHNKLWKILQVMGLPDHLTCLLRNLYSG